MDVYGPNESARGRVYRLADALHVSTRESVIRRFLLFHEGEPFDPVLLEETERNLRDLPFIKSASVTYGPPHDGSVDVDVVTQDTWTTDLITSFGKRGGSNTLGVGFRERNLLGSGMDAHINVERGVDRTTRSFEYHDPYLMGPYFEGDFLYSNNSDGSERMLEINRPFYSDRASWSVDLRGDRLERVVKTYSGGMIDSRFADLHTDVVGEFSKALRAQDYDATRLSLGFEVLSDTFGENGGTLPESRSFRYLYTRFEMKHSDYLKMNFVNRDLRYEDFNLGRKFSIQLGVSPSGLGSRETVGLLSASASRGIHLGGQGYILGDLSIVGRIDGGPRNAILKMDVELVKKVPSRVRQTFVSRFCYRRGWNLDPEVQFMVDGENGLRAYRIHAFAGDRSLIINVEQRIFSGREFFQLVSPSLALFLDTGTATYGPLGIRDLHADVGAGLRFGIARASQHDIIRIDAGYALNPDALGRRGLLLSFSSGQAF
jgi:hypothetical protein